MRTLVCSSAAALLALPAQAASSHARPYSAARHVASRDLPNGGNGGFLTGPWRQGTPMDNDPIWRRGFYQGNDPDQGIRFDLMRDGRNYSH
jgi:hypothetical protein